MNSLLVLLKHFDYSYVTRGALLLSEPERSEALKEIVEHCYARDALLAARVAAALLPEPQRHVELINIFVLFMAKKQYQEGKETAELFLPVLPA